MVIFSKEVQNVLNELYFSEFAKNVSTPRYYVIKEKLLNLDKSYINRRRGRYPAWAQGGMLEIQIGSHIFGYSWDGTTIYIEEYFKEKAVENQQTQQIIRLTETEFNEILTQSIREVIKEEFDYSKTSYQAKPKSNGGLNDWELFRILSTIIGELVSDEKITKEDGQMLLHYALYNNDCWG